MKTFPVRHSRRQKSTVAQRVRFVKRRAEESRAWHEFVTNHAPFANKTRAFIVREMKEAGLLSKRTSFWDVNLDALFELVRR